MSRAFTKDREDEPELRVSVAHAEPYYVSASGLARLERELAATEDPALRAELEERLERAVTPPVPADPSVIGFGAAVVVDSVGKPAETFTIVGDDEVDVRSGKIGMLSPLSEALLGRRAGERATWRRPAGDRVLRIRNVTYDKRAS